MAEIKTLKSPASKAAPKAKPAPKAVAIPAVTRLRARPKKDIKNGPTMTEEEAKAKAAENVAEQNVEAAQQAADDAGSSAPHPHAPGYEAARPGDETATSEDAGVEPNPA